MPLSDIAQITIRSISAKIQGKGFGIPLILSNTTLFSERVRYYTDASGWVDDGGLTTDVEYLMLSVFFAQASPPLKVGVGRRLLLPTYSWLFTPVVQNSHVYTVYVDGQPATYTSDSSATAAEIVTGLKAAVDALSLAVTTSGTTTMTITATVAGKWHDVYPENFNDLAFNPTHSDPGVATDLAAIQVYDDQWYTVVNPNNSKAEGLAIAAWVESAQKLFLAASPESAAATVAKGSDTGGSQTFMEAVDAANYVRTAVIFHPIQSEFADAAWIGEMAAYAIGEATWKFKPLAGVTATRLTTTQQGNLDAKSGNYYYDVGGTSMTSPGVSGSGEYIDITQSHDWLLNAIQVGLANLLISTPKIPGNQRGATAIEGVLRQKLDDAVDAGIINADYTITVPVMADRSAEDKAARKALGFKFAATWQGAVHQIGVTGDITV